MKKIICISLVIFLLSACVLVAACEKQPDNVDAGAKVIDPKVIEVTENFIDRFWDSKYNAFFKVNTKQITLSAGPGLGMYSDFWWEAQNWETVMDVYEHQGGENYLGLIDSIYDGFIEIYEHYSDNRYNDDIGWWAMGCTRAYAITGNERYLADAKEMFDYIYENTDEVLGGGMYWNTDRKDKNVCTNAPAIITAARLSVLLNEPSYLEKAKSLFTWLSSELYDSESGRVNDTRKTDGTTYEGQFSYNYGTFARAAYELYLASEEESYLDYTEKPLDYYLESRLIDGIAKDEGDGDGAAFRTVLFRTLNIFAKTTRPDYQKIINDNALATYENRREIDSLCGYDWTTVPSDDALITSTMVAASVSLMQFYQP